MSERVGLVLGGGGARGAYEVGVLAELLPALRDRGERVSIITGASSGAINAVALAGLLHLSPDEIFERGRARWREVVLRNVVGSIALRQVPQLVLRYLGSSLGVPGARLPALFDPVPLRRHLPRWLDVPQGRRNLAQGLLDRVGAVTTNAHTGRPTVFVSGSSPPPRDRESMVFVHEDLRVDTVQASAAIPGLFPPVEVAGGTAPGWYLDGVARLRSPLLPALALGADRIIVVATDAGTAGRTHAEDPRRPGLAEGLAHVLQGLMIDELFADMRRLARFNALVEQADDDSLERWRASLDRSPLHIVPYAFVTPQEHGELADLATEVLSSYHGGPRSLRATDMRLLDRMLGADTPLHGALLSYLLFERDFIDGAIELGRRDGRRWLADHPGLWRLRP